MLHAVVPAAGVGSRMQADIPKQYLPLAGTSVIEQTLDLLLRVSGMESITVAISDGDPYWPELAISRHARIIRAPGGAERADSVLNALRRLRQQAAGDEWVLVHDAARPCVSIAEIERLVATCSAAGQGGILAMPVHDTMKRADARNRIVATVPREHLWHACTPQMFRIGELIDALESALRAGHAVTDEASAMEMAGQRPLLVECSSANIKITRPDDLALAEFHLGRH